MTDQPTLQDYLNFPPLSRPGKIRLIYQLENQGREDDADALRDAWNIRTPITVAKLVENCKECLDERDEIIRSLETELAKLRRYLNI